MTTGQTDDPLAALRHGPFSRQVLDALANGDRDGRLKCDQALQDVLVDYLRRHTSLTYPKAMEWLRRRIGAAS